jgi:hypothetical protein
MSLKSSKLELQEFKKSFIWNDIVSELTMWKKGFDIELKNLVDTIADSNASTANVLTHLGDLNGRIKTVDYVLGLPDILISLVEEQNESKSKSADRSDTE